MVAVFERFAATGGLNSSLSLFSVPVCSENLSSGVMVVESAKDGM